jgi:mevalonate kinase
MPHPTAPANGTRNGTSLSNGHSHKADISLSSQESLVDSMDGVGMEVSAKPQPHRKLSSPLMPAFMVSAPGKVIVYGEHAVVHGKVGLRILDASSLHGVC